MRTNGVNAYYGPVAPVVAGLTSEVALTVVDARSTRVHCKLKLLIFVFLSDPGVPGVRSMGPVVSH